MKLTTSQLKNIIKEEVARAKIRKIVHEVTSTMTNLDSLRSRLKHTDWFYEYADDPSAWRSGRAAVQKLTSELSALTQEELQDLASTPGLPKEAMTTLTNAMVKK